MFEFRLALAGALAVAFAPSAFAQDSQRVRTDKVEVVVETVARDLQNPWGLAFLPDNRMLVTEKPGRLRIVSADGKLSRTAERRPESRRARTGRLARRRAVSGLRAKSPRLPELRRRSRRRAGPAPAWRAVVSMQPARHLKTRR